jgi:hypothetical protein
MVTKLEQEETERLVSIRRAIEKHSHNIAVCGHFMEDLVQKLILRPQYLKNQEWNFEQEFERIEFAIKEIKTLFLQLE